MGFQRVIFLLPTATVAAATATRIQHIPTLAGLAGICTLVVVGGDGTMSACALLVDRGVNCIGIPKTIDNDCFATEVSAFVPVPLTSLHIGHVLSLGALCGWHWWSICSCEPPRFMWLYRYLRLLSFDIIAM